MSEYTYYNGPHMTERKVRLVYRNSGDVWEFYSTIRKDGICQWFPFLIYADFIPEINDFKEITKNEAFLEML